MSLHMALRAVMLNLSTTPKARQMELTGKLLIAMPDMEDPRFSQSVVLMCSHSAEGAMGLILNKPVPELTLSDLLRQLEVEGTQHASQPVHFGGPVETSRGFVLHSAEYRSALQSEPVDQLFALSATLDALEDIAAGRGPQDFLLMLGYSGWGPGQLEAEIAANGWLTAEAGYDLVFNCAADEMWTQALKSMGIDPLILSSEAGHA